MNYFEIEYCDFCGADGFCDVVTRVNTFDEVMNLYEEVHKRNGYIKSVLCADGTVKRECWVSYWTEDGRQCGATLLATDYDDIERQLRKMYQETDWTYGGIADYDFFDEMD